MAGISDVSQLACTVSATGITAPTYADILSYLQTAYQGIYGSDVVLDNSTQDGQWIGIIAQAINATNAAMIATYNGFSPKTAQGAGLSSVVAINGITRSAATYSVCDVTLTGTAGTVIAAGSVKDSTYGYTWSLPTATTIASTGAITVTATCTTAGAIIVAAGTLTTINTPTLGWATVSNASASNPGQAGQTDAALRVQQAASTMLPSQTVMDGIVGGILSLSGVSACQGYENDTDSTDSNGLAANAIALVVEGGDDVSIATVIANKKTLGTPTAGTTTQTVTDSSGTSRTINFYRPAETTITVQISLTALTGYTDAIGSAAAAQVAAYIAGLSIGSTIYTTRLYAKATLSCADGGDTYDLTSILIGQGSDTPSAANVTLAFNAQPVCTTSDVTVTASSST